MSAAGPLFGQALTTLAAPSFEETFTVLISVNGIGDNTVRAAVADRRWVLTYLVLITGTTGNTILLKSGAGTNLSGAMPAPANTFWAFGDGKSIILRAADVNQGFVINLTAAQPVVGWAQMREIGLR